MARFGGGWGVFLFLYDMRTFVKSRFVPSLSSAAFFISVLIDSLSFIDGNDVDYLPQ